MKTEAINLLLIEDNPGDARLIQEFLKMHPGRNFNVLLAATLAEGLDRLGSDNVDVVVSDLGLPDSQGKETLQKIQQLDASVPVVVITGNNDTALAMEAVKQGAQDFLEKGTFGEQLLFRTIKYAIDRKEAENRKLLVNRILRLLNQQKERRKLIRDILADIRQYIKIDGIAMRLTIGQDFPYYEQQGFSEDFITSENFICSQDESGKPLTNTDGKPMLECWCGNVLLGRVKAEPCYTPYGSFWTNSTTRSKDEISEAENEPVKQNQCNKFGYESVALIPLHSGNEIVGLLQLNGRNPDRFTHSLISFLEEIAGTLGIAFSRMEAERKNQERIKELHVLHNLSIFAEISNTVEEYLEGILDLIGKGFQDEELTTCSVQIGTRFYESTKFRQSKHLYGSDIFYNDRKIGRLEVGILNSSDLFDPTGFLQEEKELVITIAKQIGVYVGRWRASRIQQVIYDISSFTHSTGNLSELVIFIQKQLSSLIDTTNFYIAMYNEENDSISIPYFADQKDQITSFPAGKTLTAYVINTKKSLLATRADLDRLAEQGSIETIGEKALVWLGIPLMVKGKVIGVFAIQSYTDPNAYDKEDLAILEVISRQISLSVERKKSETELLEALEKARESDRVKSLFLANMSHELRTPLNAVIGFSQLIDKNSSIEDILEFMPHILKGGHHLLEIIEEILNVSLMESGNVVANKEVCSLGMLMEQVDEVITREQEKMQKHKVKITYHAPDFKADHGIVADGEKVKQVLMNLLKNALKFTTEGTVDYGILLETEGYDPMLKFYVRDTGIGIGEEAKKIIFELFRQAEETHTRNYGGTGLGLSVSQKLVELMGGKIWVESEPGKGSDFSFTIPFELAQSVEAEADTLVSPEMEIPKSTITVLVAEDEDSNFELLDILLSGKGYDILWAKNGQEAVDFCTGNARIDIILMDLKMPVINGYDATRMIRDLRPDLPIIAQTAYALPSDREEAISAGCNDLLTKPINKRDLFNSMEKWLT